MYCYAPLFSLSIYSDGHIGTCCRQSIEPNKLIELFNNNNIPKRCLNCYYERKTFNYFHNKYGYVKKNKWLHIHLGNKCNFKCIMCELSKDNFIEYKEFDLNFINNIELKDLEFVTIQGGETFLYYDILKKIINFISNNTLIKIITNGSIYDEKIIKLLKNKNLILVFSVDGYKEHNDMIRIGSNYNNIIENIKKYSSYFNINVNYTISIFNICDLIDDLFFLSKELPKRTKIILNPVITPNKMSVVNLNNEIKKSIYEQIFNEDNLIKIKFLSSYNYINFEPLYNILNSNSSDFIKYEDIKDYILEYNFSKNFENIIMNKLKMEVN